MYRFLVDVLEPFSVAWLMLAASTILMWRKTAPPRRWAWGMTSAFLFLTLISTPTVAFLTLTPLERRYEVRSERPPDLSAIIVLAGSLREADHPDKFPQPGRDTVYRCLEAARMYHAGPPCPVILAGGRVSLDDGPSLAEVMRAFMIQLQVRADDIVLETESRTTYENAREVAEIVAARKLERVMLVTDALHMWRSDLCFRRQGVDVIPCGTSYTTREFRFGWRSLWPSPEAMILVHRATHEWMGIAWYWLHGRI